MGNKNTKFFDDLSKGATWSAGVAFKRSNPLPLDRYSVFETKALAEAYATSNAVAYPGQVIAVAEGNKMVAYVLAENAAGDALVLQQIGIIPTGDDKTIEVTEDGVISLLAADTEVFKKDAEGNPTEEKEINAGAQLVLQADGTLKWVKPDTTTVEGLSTAVTDLQGRMTTAETDIDALETKVGKATEGEDKPATGLYALIDAETARATAAEKALDDAIKAIDFMDSGEVADAIEEGIKDLATKKYVDDELAKKVNVETYNNDKKALADEDAAIREIAEGVKARVDAFLDGTGTEAALDSLQELISYIDEHDDVDIAGILEDIEGIEDKLVGIDTTVAAYVTAAIDALKIGDYAKAADLTALAGRVTTLEGKVDVDKVSEAIADAEGRAATDAQSKANQALADAKADTDTKLANYYKKTETNSKEEIAAAIAEEANRADKAEKANAANIEAIAKDYLKAVDKQELQGAIDLKANQTALNATDAIVATKADASALESAISTLESKITTAQNQANKGVSDAATAQAAAEAAQAKADSNAVNIDQHSKELYGEGEGEQKVKGLVEKVSANTSDIADIKGTLTSHDGRITAAANAAAGAQSTADAANTLAGTKADQTYVETEIAKLATKIELTEAIKGVNGEISKTNAEVAKKADTTYVDEKLAEKADKATTYTKDDIDGKVSTINGEIAKKADADKVYTKDEIDATVSGINTEIGEKADKTYVNDELSKRDTAISDALAEAKKYADDNDADTKYGIVYDKENKKIKLTNNVSDTEIDATDFIKDGMIESVELSEDGLNLVITWNTDSGKTDVTTIPLAGLVDVYTGVDGEQIKVAVSADNKISAELKTAVTDDITKGVAAKAAIDTYGNIVTHNVAEFATKAQGDKADTAVQPGDLDTMAKEIADDYVKKSDATGYADILTKTEAATTYQPVGNYAPADINTGVMSVTSLHDAIVVTPGENGAITINFADEIILNGGGANVATE